MDTRFSEDVRPLKDLKAKASEVVEHVIRSRRPVLITRRGKGVAVLVSLDEYERMRDRLAFVRAVEQGADAAARGRLRSNDEAMGILDSFGRRTAK